MQKPHFGLEDRSECGFYVRCGSINLGGAAQYKQKPEKCETE